mgnify:CR=1 FL=1
MPSRALCHDSSDGVAELNHVVVTQFNRLLDPSLVHVCAVSAADVAQEGAHLEVLLDGQAGEHVVVLRDVADAALDEVTEVAHRCETLGDHLHRKAVPERVERKPAALGDLAGERAAYFNTGTWRTVHQIAHQLGGRPTPRARSSEATVWLVS